MSGILENEMPPMPIFSEPLPYEYAIVVNTENIMTTFVLIQPYVDREPEVIIYPLKEGERIITNTDWQKATALVALWTIVRFDEENNDWIGEGDEIEQPEPLPITPIIQPFSAEQAEFLFGFIEGFNNKDESEENI